MKFECGDLDRAMANADLLPEAREHFKTCAACRREYRLWNEISATARELHEEWDTPALWPAIRDALQAERKPEVLWWKQWKTWAIAAALAIVIAVPLGLWRRSVVTTPAVSSSSTPDFLTEQALREVETTEAAYRQSIEKLSKLAAPKLAAASSPAVVNEKERLSLLDSAIAETGANVASNRFNIRLQTALADLYRQKQETLHELLNHDAKN